MENNTTKMELNIFHIPFFIDFNRQLWNNSISILNVVFAEIHTFIIKPSFGRHIEFIMIKHC